MSHVKISKVHPRPNGKGYEFFVAHGDTAREAREQVERYEAKIARRRSPARQERAIRRWAKTSNRHD